MKRTTERKWHSWLNGVALTICPSMWRRQRRLCWTSGGGTPLTTPHWPSTARLWRESAALNSWGCTSRRISPGPPTPCHSPRRHNSAYTFSAGWKEQVSHHLSLPHSTGAPSESVLTSCITVWYGNCSASDRKTLQRTVNTAAKIIGAPLPSILDIFHGPPPPPLWTSKIRHSNISSVYQPWHRDATSSLIYALIWTQTAHPCGSADTEECMHFVSRG